MRCSTMARCNQFELVVLIKARQESDTSDTGFALQGKTDEYLGKRGERPEVASV